jgi:DNA-binding transcriptional MerR regulator
VPQDAFTLPQLAKILDVQYRTLHSWVERELLRPSIQQSSGTGTHNLFSEEDAVMASVLADLREAGVKFDLLEQAAARLRGNSRALREEAYLLVNGDVTVVFDEQEALSALRRGGLTLAYNTGEALGRFEQLAVAA